MKTLVVVFLIIYLTTSCDKEGSMNSEAIDKIGFVSYDTKPYYNNDSIYFSVKVLVTLVEDRINLEYSIKDESATIINN